MILVVAPPAPAPEPPPPPPSPTPSLRYDLTAPWLDRSWELTNPAGSVVKLEGATLPVASPTHWREEAPALNGVSWSGYRTGSDQAFIPLLVQGEDPEAFLEQHSALMEALDPGQLAVLRVTRPDGQWREIRLRFDEAQQSADLDVMRALYATYGVTWTAEDPFWRGPEVVRRFEYAAPSTNFFSGPPFRLAPSEMLGRAQITNPGEIESHAVWRVEGPFTGFSVGIGDSLVESAISKTLGGFVDIDMNPDRLTIVDENGEDRWDDVTEVSFSPIPPGTTRLTTVVTGPGAGTAVQVSFAPRYRRSY